MPNYIILRDEISQYWESPMLSDSWIQVKSGKGGGGRWGEVGRGDGRCSHVKRPAVLVVPFRGYSSGSSTSEGVEPQKVYGRNVPSTFKKLS